MAPYLDSRDRRHKKTARRRNGGPKTRKRPAGGAAGRYYCEGRGKEPDAVPPVGDEGETAPGLSVNAAVMRGRDSRREVVISKV